MELNISISCRAISQEQISAFELKHNFVFPQAYKEFLLKYNGGSITPDVFAYHDRIYGEEDSILDRLLCIGDDNYFNIEDYIKRYNLTGRIPLIYVPIGTDLGANVLVINVELNSANYGKIFLWDHDIEGDDNDNIYEVNETFTDFLNSLHN
jgi:hypothetical protein